MGSQPAGGPVDHRTRPRRRGETLYTAIFEATLAELADVGYSRLAMERVAARAHTSKASLYKRWPTRADLVLAALRHRRGEPAPTPDTGSLRGDVLALLRGGAAQLDGLMGEVIRGLMAEGLRESTPIATVRTTMFDARNRRMSEVIERAVERGEIQREVITPERLALAPALVDHHFLFYGAPIPDHVLTGIVDSILLPLLTGARPVRPGDQDGRDQDG